jgi:hypothetical protein
MKNLPFRQEAGEPFSRTLRPRHRMDRSAREECHAAVTRLWRPVGLG